MRWKFWLFLGFGFAMALPQQRIDAQAARVPRRGAVLPDSAAWRPLLIYIITNLSHNVLDAAIDTTPQPWKMSYPNTGAAWPAIETHLRTVLRARDVMPSDTVVHELRIGELTVRGDTAWVRVNTGVTITCPGTTGTGGYGNRDDVFAVRTPTGVGAFWSVARSAGVLHGDRFGCRARRP